LYLIDELAQIIEGKFLSSRDHLEIASFSIDSRKCTQGACFIALPGERTHGGEFIESAFLAGAAAAIVDRRWVKEKYKLEDSFVENLSRTFGNIIVVNDAREALWKLAKFHRKRFSPLTIAVTGTAGKTSTKELIAHILSSQFEVLASPSSFNNDLGVPLTILKLDGSHEAYVQELGASEIGSIRRLAELVCPSIGVLTNVGIAHLEGFGSPDAIYKAKLELAEILSQFGGTLIFNGNDLNIHKLLKSNNLRKVSFGSPDSPWGIKETRLEESKQVIKLNNGEEYRIPSLAPFQVWNSLAAVTVARLAGLSFEVCSHALETVEWPSGRFNFNKLGEDIIVIDDTYNANPTAFSASLKALKQVEASRYIVVSGDMLELGSRSSHYHEELGREMAETDFISAVISVGKESEAVSKTAQRQNKNLNSWHFHSNSEAFRFLKSYLKPGDAVLIKGSRGMHLEEIVKDLKECFTSSPAS